MPTIAVLEDDQRRITAIRAAARTHFADHDIRVFLSAREMIAWLSSGPQDVRLISLDCDLDSTAVHDDTCSRASQHCAGLDSCGDNHRAIPFSGSAFSRRTKVIMH